MAKYYVDNSGSDGDGSINRPWNNIAGHVNSLNPGDTLHIMGDPVTPQTYNESVTITASGTSGNLIILQPYSTDLIVWTSGGGQVSLELDGDYIKVNGKNQLDFDKQLATGAQAIKIDGAHCTIVDAEVQRVRSVVSMIYITGDYATLTNLKIHNGFNSNSTDCHGVNIANGIGTVVEGCEIYDVHGDCIYTNDPVSNIPREFIIRNNTLTATEPGKCSENAIDLKGSPADGGWSLVYGNRCAGFRACDASCGGSGDATGEAITVHNSAHRVKVYGNIISDCTGGVVVDDGVEDVWVYKNVFYNMNKRDPDASHLAAITIRAKGVKVWNNTFYACDETIRVITHPNFGDNEVRNNVFLESGDVVGSGTSGVTWSHNAWHNCGTVKRGTGDVTADPKLTDPANGNMALQAASPCIDAGVDVGLPYEGDAPDLGVFERGSSSTRGNIERCIREVRATAAQLETCIAQLETCVSLLEDCL